MRIFINSKYHKKNLEEGEIEDSDEGEIRDEEVSGLI